MKKTTLIHAIWLTVALGAFGAGHFSSKTRGGAGIEGRSPVAQGAIPRVIGGGAETGEDRLAAGKKPDSQSDGRGRLAEVFQLKKGFLEDHEIAQVAKEAFSDPNPLKRQLAFAKLLESMTPENAELIREQMRGADAEGDQWRLFQYAWGAVDGEGALAAAMKVENKDRRQRGMSQALSGWAGANPKEAIAYFNSLENGEEKAQIEGSLVGGLADNDIGAATDYVLKLVAAGDERATGFLESVAGEALRKDGPEVAAMWAERLPDGAAKGGALDTIANRYVAKDPKAAAAWAEQFAQADYGARVIEEVGDEWAGRDPASAVGWLEGLGDSSGKSQGLRSALGEWAQKDPTAASQYLVDMPQSELKDAAVSGFASRIAWEDPESAIVWADSIGQENVRTDTLTRAAQAFFVRNREAALEWLPNSGLSPEAQKKVLETRRGRGRDRG